MSLLKIENLTHAYDSGHGNSGSAISNISFEIEKGDMIGIIGHTGSGKSTLVTHLNGLLKPTEGKIYLDGKDIWQNPKEIRKIRSKIGLVFQYPEYQLFEETVFEDIAYGPKNMGKTDSEVEEVVLRVAMLMNIREDLLKKSPFDLSGGEKRRVAIAGVLAMTPEIVVFDEPTAGLDPKGRETIFKAISDYKAQYGATVIIVSHSMEDIASLTNKVLVLSKGQLVAFDTTRNIFSNPERLRCLGLGIPMISEIFEKLNISDTLPLTVDEGMNLIRNILENGGNKRA